MELIGCIKTVGETTTNIRYVTTQKIENIKYHYVCEINVGGIDKLHIHNDI